MAEIDTDLEGIEGAERKLAAVMFTDIKGFSKKMAENETAAFDLLKKHDALLRVLSTKFGGKVVKSIGDSFMVDFASAVNAVKCAIEAQKRFHQQNQGKSEFDKIEIRAGIHLGDVLIRGDDIFGDGVNIASRIESIAAPTRVCITSDVYNQVRKSMDVEVFRMGDMKLKNIPEPVEVFEILIPDIPEFSKPSAKAAEESKKQSLEAGEKHAQRVAGHESHVQEFHQQALLMSDAEKRTQAEELYERAEKFFQMGRIEDAEAELKKVEELVPSFEPAESRREEEEEREQKVQVLLAKARELISTGNLDEAEAETKKVFEHYPLHVGAQQILVRIEEERYRLEEEERLKRAAERQQVEQSSIEHRQVTDILEKAKKQRDNESFTEAIYTLREVFNLDPNNSVARTLEQEIRKAQEEKAARDRIAAEEEEKRLEEERLERQRRRKERVAAERAARKVKVVEKKKGSRKWLVVGVILIAAGVALYLSLPTIVRTFFPVRISVAALPFTGADARGLTQGLPLAILEDLSRVNNVSIRAATSSFGLDARTFTTPGASNPLNISHVLTGSLETTERGTEVTVRLLDVGAQKAAFARRFVLALDRFPVQRAQLVGAIIDELGIDGVPPPITQRQVSAEAYQTYLAARVLVQYDGYDQLQEARASLEEMLRTVNGFPEATATLAEVYARLWRLGAATGDALQYAASIAQQAARELASDPQAIRALAVTQLASGDYSLAKASVQRGLALSAQSAEFHRLAAELSLISGDYESAAESIARASSIDPSNPRTFMIKGWLAHYRGENSEAARLYEAAIAAGGNRSYITSSVLASAWLRGTNRDGAVRYYKGLVEARREDYKSYYKLGRAYAEKLDSARTAFTEGLRIATRTVESDRSDDIARAYMALFQTRLGRFNDATTILDRLRSDGTTNPIVLYRLANAYALQAKKEEALELLSSALDAQFQISEVLNPDFGGLFDDPDFRATIKRSIEIPK